MIIPPPKKSTVSDPTSAQHAWWLMWLDAASAPKNRSLRVLPIHRCGRVEVKPWDTLSLNFNPWLPTWGQSWLKLHEFRNTPGETLVWWFMLFWGVPFRLTCIMSKLVWEASKIILQTGHVIMHLQQSGEATTDLGNGWMKLLLQKHNEGYQWKKENPA